MENVAVTRNIAILRGVNRMQKLRLTVNETCHFLSVQRDKLNKMVKDDLSFPRPIKEGVTRQSAVYFDHNELVEWWEVKKMSRINC